MEIENTTQEINQPTKMTNINFFGGPGTGKSTAAAGLFHVMKTQGKKVEYVSEYAKELVYSKDFYKLKDQLYILAKQHHPWFKLEHQVDFTINDGPFILGCVYLQEGPHLNKRLFEALLVDIWKSFQNVNIFLERDTEFHEYQEYGRGQTLEEALMKDDEIKNMLDSHDIKYHVVKVGDNMIPKILTIIEEETK